MDEITFKKQNKPAACTRPPWESLIPNGPNKENILRAIRSETIAAYGESFDECPKRKTCLTQTCIGRPLPWASPTAKPYLDQLKATQTIVNDEMYIQTCGGCPIANYCTSTCSQVNDYLQRDKTTEPELIYKDKIENITPHGEDYQYDVITTLLGKGKTIPWDILNAKRQDIVKKYLYENKDFATVAKECGLYDEAAAKYSFYSSLTKLSEFATMREWLQNNEPEGWFVKSDSESRNYGILLNYYVYNKTMQEVASEYKLAKNTVSDIIKRTVDTNKISWNVYVKKEKNKLIYNVPGVLK